MLGCRAFVLVLVALAAFVAPVRADLKDIHAEKLPASPAIQQAYADALSVEPMVRGWSARWPYDTPKEEVIAKLTASLATLEATPDRSPKNEELELLTGLVAHYAYNVDVDGSYDLASKAFDEAGRLAPEDYRPQWFLASLDCQTLKSAEGMERFLSLERQMSWNEAPVDFWEDYLACSALTLMPAHAARAADHLRALGAAESDYARILELGQLHVLTPDLNASYQNRQVWSAADVRSETVFTSTIFGLRFAVPSNWTLELSAVKHGVGDVQIGPGPYPSPAGRMTPTILILVRPAKAGETPQQFLDTMAKNEGASAVAPLFCPSDPCLAARAVKPGAYQAAGDGYAFFTVFQRNEPDYPGLLFEEPATLPRAPKDDKATFYRPNDRLSRLKGTLCYLVLLDTAGSFLDRAQQDYIRVLKSIQVE